MVVYRKLDLPTAAYFSNFQQLTLRCPTRDVAIAISRRCLSPLSNVKNLGYFTVRTLVDLSLSQFLVLTWLRCSSESGATIHTEDSTSSATKTGAASKQTEKAQQEVFTEPRGPEHLTC